LASQLVTGHQFARALQEQLLDLERLVLQLDAHTLLPKLTRARVHLEDSKSLDSARLDFKGHLQGFPDVSTGLSTPNQMARLDKPGL
jgi:hypothetical protein